MAAAAAARCKLGKRLVYDSSTNKFKFNFSRFSSTMPSSQFQSVGFIGLGNMGSRMAHNLIKAGFILNVLDKNYGVMNTFSDLGATIKQTPFQVAQSSDVVLTMLPSSSHVINVYTGPNGLLHGGHLKTRLFIDSSTIDPQTSIKLSAAVATSTLKEKYDNWVNPVMLDAPVSGGVLAAEAGTLTFMVGGSEDAYLAAKPIFLSMGKNTIHCGGSGTGSAAKICNNLAMAVSMLGVSEALALGQSLGISASTLTKIFNSSSARCWSSDTYNPVPGVMEGVPSSREYVGGFSTKLMAKDLNLAAASAAEVGHECPLTSKAQAIYTDLCKEGHETEDFSCVFRHYYSGKDEQ
ncbi:hypothetical protein ACFE04_013966 [Oxalis oulophora]